MLRGSRYTLALFVPLTVTAMAMAAPALEVWLGARFREAAPALTILVSYWLLWGMLAVTPNFLVGAGRARQAALVVAGIAGLNLALSLALTPSLGIEGPALGTAIAYVAGFPLMLRIGLGVGGLSLGELARGAWLPAYALGAVLAAALVGVAPGAGPGHAGGGAAHRAGRAAGLLGGLLRPGHGRGRARVRALAGQTLNGRSSAISDSFGADASRSE